MARLSGVRPSGREIKKKIVYAEPRDTRALISLGRRTARVVSARSAMSAEQRQLVVDDLLELGLRLRAAQEDPINKEAGSAANACLVSRFQIGFDPGLEFAALEA